MHLEMLRNIRKGLTYLHIGGTELQVCDLDIDRKADSQEVGGSAFKPVHRLAGMLFGKG